MVAKCYPIISISLPELFILSSEEDGSVASEDEDSSAAYGEEEDPSAELSLMQRLQLRT